MLKNMYTLHFGIRTQEELKFVGCLPGGPTAKGAMQSKKPGSSKTQQKVGDSLSQKTHIWQSRMQETAPHISSAPLLHKIFWPGLDWVGPHHQLSALLLVPWKGFWNPMDAIISLCGSSVRAAWGQNGVIFAWNFPPSLPNSSTPLAHAEQDKWSQD